MRISRLTVPLSHDSKLDPWSSKLVRNYWEKSRIDMFKELFRGSPLQFRGSPLQFRGHDSFPASKTTSYDKTLDLWLCNTEAACMYATRLKLTTSHFLAFLIRKTEFDQMIKPHSTLDPRSFWELSIKDQVSRDFQLSFEQYCIRSQLLPWSYAKFSTSLHGKHVAAGEENQQSDLGN